MDLKKYDAVGFDAFGTLIQGGNKVDGYHFQLVKKYRGNLKKAHLLTNNYSQDSEIYFKDSFLKAGVDYNILTEIEKFQLDEYYRETFNDYKLFDGTEELLNKVKNKVEILFLISNISSLYIPVIEKLGLNNYFNFIIYSCKFGAKKSIYSTRIFNGAYKEIGRSIAKNKVIYTGDNRNNDEIAPRNAGFDSINIIKFRQEVLGDIKNITP